jgi:transposase
MDTPRTPLTRGRSAATPKPKRSLSVGHIAKIQAGAEASRARERAFSLGASRHSAMSKRVRHAGREARLEITWDEYYLKDLADQMPARGRGVPVRHEESVRALVGYYSASKFAERLGITSGVTNAQRVACAELMSNLSHITIKKIVKQYERDRTIYAEPLGLRGAAADTYMRWERLPADAESRVRVHIYEKVTVNEEPFHYTRMVLRDFLQEEFDYECSIRVCGDLLSRWGYKYGKLGRTSLGANSVVRQIAKQIFIVQIDSAIKRNHVIIFSDESYINERLGAYMGYAPSDNHVSASVPTHAGLGKRLCIVLLNDVEHYLAQLCPRVHIIWCAPNCPELSPIEMVWAQGKGFAAEANTGKRNLDLARHHLHEGFYSYKVARPNQSNVHGGLFVRDPTSKKCESAAALYRHAYGPNGPAHQLIKDDAILGQVKFQGVAGKLVLTGLSSLDRGVVDEALEYTTLAQIKFLTAKRLAAARLDAADTAEAAEYLHGFTADPPHIGH